MKWFDGQRGYGFIKPDDGSNRSLDDGAQLARTQLRGVPAETRPPWGAQARRRLGPHSLYVICHARGHQKHFVASSARMEYCWRKQRHLPIGFLCDE